MEVQGMASIDFLIKWPIPWIRSILTDWTERYTLHYRTLYRWRWFFWLLLIVIFLSFSLTFFFSLFPFPFIDFFISFFLSLFLYENFDSQGFLQSQIQISNLNLGGISNFRGTLNVDFSVNSIVIINKYYPKKQWKKKLHRRASKSRCSLCISFVGFFFKFWLNSQYYSWNTTTVLWWIPTTHRPDEWRR